MQRDVNTELEEQLMLPDDTAHHILIYVGFKECHKLRRVCKAWNQITQNLVAEQCSILYKELAWGEKPYFVRKDLNCSNAKYKGDDKYNIYHANKSDKILFTFKPENPMNEEDFETFRNLNGMAGRLYWPLTITMPYCILYVPERQPSKDMRKRHNHGYSDYRDLGPEEYRSTPTDTVTPDWPKLSPRLHSITTNYVQVMSTVRDNKFYMKDLLDKGGFIYEMYFRMCNNDVWYMKIENRVTAYRYTNFDE
jgi:hypothetical protein